MQTANGRRALRGLAAILLALMTLAVWRWDMAVPSSAAKWDAASPVRRVERGDARVALTFDSGWGEDYTLDVLEILKAHGVQATFFLTGYWIDENPATVQAIVDAGHELGGHSVTHSRMVGMDNAAMDAEIGGVSERIAAFTGRAPRCFRPPYGDWDLALLGRIQLRGQVAVTWSVDAQSAMNAAGMRAALDSVRSGDIVLMSLCDAALATELDEAIAGLEARGIRLCTVSALMGEGCERFVEARRVKLHALARRGTVGRKSRAGRWTSRHLRLMNR